MKERKEESLKEVGGRAMSSVGHKKGDDLWPLTVQSWAKRTKEAFVES